MINISCKYIRSNAQLLSTLEVEKTAKPLIYHVNTLRDL